METDSSRRWQTRLWARREAVGWACFGLFVAVVLGYSFHLHRKVPLPVASAAVTPDGKKFNLDEKTRRAIFQELVRSEVADQLSVRKQFTETQVWNRNFDDFFHQSEARRVPGVAARYRIPAWEAWLILDEGMRAHWPPPAGVELRNDDAPLRATTRPLAERALLTPAP